MPAITLMPTLCFLSNSFFLSKFFTLLFCYFFFPYFLVLCGVAMFSLFPLLLLFPVHGGGPFYTSCHDGFLLYYPLTAFVWVWVSSVLPDHPLVCQLPSHHYLPVLVVPHLITKQRVLFCLLAHCGIPIQIRVGILSHYLSWHAPSDSNSYFPLLGGMSSQQDIFPKRV